ncbi:MAG: hypothetical protein AAGD14_09930 [Planctomycetota bacterium]
MKEGSSVAQAGNARGAVLLREDGVELTVTVRCGVLGVGLEEFEDG